MNIETVENIANAFLYPYRASSANRHRFNFGVLYPEGYDTSSMSTECLVEGHAATAIGVKIRYLRLDELDRAHEREYDLDFQLGEALREEFELGEASISSADLGRGVHRLSVSVRNTLKLEPGTPRLGVLRDSMFSVHTILTASDGRFISLLDPPENLKQAAAECRNIGTWPVLAGDEGSCDAMLSSSIVLYDYPKIAPETPGDDCLRQSIKCVSPNLYGAGS